MRIALVGPAHPYKGGGARHTTELAHRLAAAGHDVIIESWRAQYPTRLYPGQQLLDVAEGEPYPRAYRRLAWYRPDGWLAAGRRLRAADLVIFALLTPLQIPAYLTILAGLRTPGPSRRPDAKRHPRTMVICHNVLPHERRPGDITLTRTLLARVDTVLTHSPAQAAQARDLAPRTAVLTVPLPAHLPTTHNSERTGFPPPGQPPRPKETRASAQPAPGQPPRPKETCAPASPAPGDPHPGLPPGAVRLLFFGIVRPYKGLDVLLRAMAQAPGHLITLTVAGEFWGGASETEALIAELGLAGRVALRPGYLPATQIPALFAAADVLVLPYREATASQNALLAFTHGVPVITTTAGALADVVRDGVDGLTCAPGDADDLARALAAISKPGMLENLRAGIKVTDPEPGWAAYLQALTAS